MTVHLSETLRLPCEARSPSAGRRFVQRVLIGWKLEDLTDTAVLLTSEVVTNAIVHAQTGVTITVTREDDRAITISVSDGSAALPHAERNAQDAATGRGLTILQGLASSCAVIPRPQGKTVTFTLHRELAGPVSAAVAGR